MNDNNKDDGLPEVAQKLMKRKAVSLGLIGLVLLVFLSMYLHSRSTMKQDKPIEETYTLENEQQPEIKREVVSVPPPVAVQSKEEKPEVTQEQIAFIQEKQKELQQRLSAPLMVVSNSSASKQAEAAPVATTSSHDPNTQFMNQVSAQVGEESIAKAMAPLNSIVAGGRLIHATMESAINSDLPGFTRASVSESVYSEEGTQVLIPRGSRLIGQYKSGMLKGQSRVFIVWTRLITPNGVSVNLGSAGVDNLGTAGIGADSIDRHFWQQFGTASLLSILGAGAANVGVSGSDQDNSASAYRSAIANSFTQSASQSLQQDNMVAPTLKINQGKPIMIFVSRDLYFADAVQQVKPKINVF